MKKLWYEIPRTFRICVIASLILVVAISIGAFIWKNALFGIQTTITGGFSVALLCGYVIWTSRVMSSARSQMAEVDRKYASMHAENPDKSSENAEDKPSTDANSDAECDEQDGKAKSEENAEKDSIATGAVMKIQVGSLVKLFILSGFLILVIVGFRFNVVSALIGISAIYLPLFIVPLFVKSNPDRELLPASGQDNSEVHS